MPNQDFDTSMRTIAYLCGCAVRDEAPDPARLVDVSPDQLLKLASSHTLAAATATALERAGLGGKQAREEITRGIWKMAQFDTELTTLLASFEAAGIWYCPLKGLVIRDCYPAYGMRQMADYDILFDANRADDLRQIMERYGFSTEHFGTGNHDVYHKQPVCNFEMHRKLFGSGQGQLLIDYYATIKDRLLKDEGNRYGYHMSVEECYLYLVAHEHKHFSGWGTGLRSLLDTYVYLRRYGQQMDWKWISRTAEHLELDTFEEQNRALARALFDDQPLTEEQADTLSYMATSGTYGTIAHRVDNVLAEKGGGLRAKLAYLAERMFLPMDAVESGYPFFYRHKLLLPALTAYRLARAVTIRRKAVLAEIRAVRKSKQ